MTAPLDHEPHPLTEDECTSHQGTCPTPLELLRWQRDQARVEAERLSELGQGWQARARVAEAEVERLRGIVARVEAILIAAEAGADRWGTCGHEWLSLRELRAALGSADA